MSNWKKTRDQARETATADEALDKTEHERIHLLAKDASFTSKSIPHFFQGRTCPNCDGKVKKKRFFYPYGWINARSTVMYESCVSCDWERAETEPYRSIMS